MNAAELIRRRLAYQGLAQPRFDDPVEVVRWFGAVQSQDYGGAKWAVGQRMIGGTDAALDAAFNSGAILRTHVLRPTWHFVTPEDIRWMLELTAPRVRQLMTYYDRQQEIDRPLITRSGDLIAGALQGGQHRTRAELGDILSGAGINTQDNLRLTNLMIHLELDGLICSGARRGKQFTYALLRERAPQAKTLECDEALAELARRYFTSHGPATLKDYVWWSGLTTADARAGLAMVRDSVAEAEVGGQTYYFAESAPVAPPAAPQAWLLPNYDEYTVGYSDRSGLMDMSHVHNFIPRDSTLLGYTIVLDGQIVGAWKRTFKKAAVVVELSLFVPLDGAQQAALNDAARRLGEFAGLPAVIAGQSGGA
jgi:hypothetical protein